VRQKRFNWRFRSIAAVLGVASLVVASASAALGASARHAAAKDSFRGRITHATGRFASESGAVAIYIHAGRSQGATRPVDLTIVPRRCQTAQECLMLRGAPTGTLTTKRASNPDGPKTFTIQASGTVRPVGQSSVTGSGTGTGFLAKGRERMRLTLTSAHGEITIDARSAEVPGFTSP
jgi:hypothetical protein